jgi:pyruvate/2-oxoacid:ferredoxin oxidoreductase beta subunit
MARKSAVRGFRKKEIEGYLSEKEYLSRGTRACPGCAAELSYRLTQRALGKYPEAVFFGCPGCMTILMNGSGEMAGSRHAYVSCLFTNLFSTMTGVYRYFRHTGRDVKLVGFVGDGATADVSFQTLSGAAERGENIVVICYDNEAYQNTGNQQSSTTPFGARTYTSPVGKMQQGKSQGSKYMPLIMAAHNIPYVATATIVFLEDYLKKLTKALAVRKGLSYIHLYSPCPVGWGSASDSSLELSRLSVETNYFPLWESENNRLSFTYEPKSTLPVSEFTKLQGRFKHLSADQIALLQKSIDDRYRYLKMLSTIEWRR